MGMVKSLILPLAYLLFSVRILSKISIFIHIINEEQETLKETCPHKIILKLL